MKLMNNVQVIIDYGNASVWTIKDKTVTWKTTKCIQNLQLKVGQAILTNGHTHTSVSNMFVSNYTLSFFFLYQMKQLNCV